ncbi:hypothetical protein BD410DRAFT_793204 [Rickenella mellea]|uniref:DUF6533 domain-containing protein n=1 Tax=Rickenella mellea TaxID=50990 RepID=A0A4Y7PV87_9AGAM|nr:hypothetical protein BD410DRAFT_793204 [Rickenella mellea]
MAAAQIEALISLVRGANIADRSEVAACSCLVFDIILTIDQEVEYIWRSKWTLPKCLYLWARYFALFMQVIAIAETTSLKVTPTICAGWAYFEGITGQLLIMGVELLLMLRVWALYKRDKRILYFLIALYVAEITANTVILGMSLPSLTTVAPLHGLFPPGFPLSGCFPTKVPGFFFSYWIPTLVFESILFILMLFNFVRLARENTPMPLLTLFFRDGTVYYAVIFAALLIQVLLYELDNTAIKQVAIGWLLTMFSIMGTRLVLNLRAASVGAAELETVEMMKFKTRSNLKSIGHSSQGTDSNLYNTNGGRRQLNVRFNGDKNGGVTSMESESQDIEYGTPPGDSGWISEWERV